MGKRSTIGLILLVFCGTLFVDYNSKQVIAGTLTFTREYQVNSDAISVNMSWTKDLHVANNSPHYADLNGDGYLDIVFSIGLDLYCLSGKDGKQLRKKSESASFISSASPCIVNIDADPQLEVIVLGNEMAGSDMLYCYDHEGNEVWSKKVPSTYGTNPFHTSTPCIGDLNGDDVLEIIIGTRYGLLCYNSNNFTQWEYTTDYEVYSSPSLLNVDSDTNYEIIFTCNDEYIYCLDDDFELLWKTAMIGTSISTMSSPIVYDTNSDGKHEIFVGTGERFCSYAPNGTLLWSYKTAQEYNFFEGTAAISNIDNLGPIEILVRSDYGTLYCFSHTGFLNWTYEGVGTNLEQRTVALADLDGDKKQEIILVGDELVCLSNNGLEIFTYLLDYWSFSNPLVGDFDSDGILEIFYSDYLDTINCLEVLLNEPYFNSTQKSGLTVWPCFKGSNYHTGIGDYDGDMLDEFSEEYYNTNKTNSDTDFDQFLDGWEVMVGLDPLIDDAFDDLDNDNLTNYIEAKTYHTSVFNADTDGDGMDDGDEIAIGRDPLVKENETFIPTGFTFNFPIENIYTMLFASIALIVIIKGKNNK